MSRFLRILVLAAFLVQTSPLRACAWEALLPGGSCHDQETQVLDTSDEHAAIDACPDHPDSPRQSSCVCEISPRPTPRASIPATLALTPAILTGITFAIDPQPLLHPFTIEGPVLFRATDAQISLPLLR